MDIKQLLNEWGCTESVIDVFVDQDIHCDVLKDLSHEDLKDLIPNSLGMRKLLEKKISELKQDNENSGENFTVNATTLTNSPLQAVDEVMFNFDFNDFVTEVQSFQDFDLNTLLQTSPMGNSVLKYYKTNNRLQTTQRTRLVDIIIKHLYTYIINYRLRHEEYNKLAGKIISLFPNEPIAIYYMPPIKKSQSKSGKSVLARGRLVDKVRNIVQRCGEATPRRKRKLSVETSVSDIEEGNNTASFQISEEAQEDKIWLSLNIEPWEEVIRKWENTFALRRRNQNKNLQELLKEWPILETPKCDILINNDFRVMFPGKELCLYTKWIQFIDLVKKLRATPKHQDHLDFLDNLNNKDCQFLQQLLYLPELIAPKGRLVSKGKHWKFSTLEVKDSLVVLVKTPADIERTISKQKDLAASKGVTLQPFIVIEGESFTSDSNNTYLVLDKVFLKIDGNQKAFDILFKLFHVMNIKYPGPSEYIYVLIQRCIYNIVLECDKVPTHVIDIINAIV